MATVKKLSETSYEVSVTRTGDELSHLKEHVLSHFKDAKVDGFRPGHVPAKVLEQKFQKEIEGEILNHIISEEYQKAVVENELRPIADPRLEKYENKEGTVEVVFVIPVLPAITLGEYKGVEVEKETLDITDEKVNAEIERLKEGAAKLKEVEADATAELNDVANIDFEGFDLTLGSHSFIDNFEDQIVGHKKGDEFDVTVMFPENYGAENLAGKPAIFKVKVNSIKRKEEAELNDDLAKELGYDSLEDLKVKTRESLTKREETRINNEFKGKVVEAVVANTNVEVPAELTNREVEYQINRFAQQLQMQGISLEQYFQMTGQTLDKMREESREMAEKSVKTELVLSEITKAENIEVSDDEVNAEIDKMATMYGMDKEALLADVRKSGNYARFIDETKYRLSHEKTIDLLVNSAKVK